MFKAGILFLLFFSTSIFAENITIEMLNVRASDKQSMVYSTDVAEVQVGDTINWIPKDKGHNVEFVLGPDSVELPKKSRINKEFFYTFETPGIYFYQCTPHKSMGMIAIVVVGGDLSNLVQVKKVRVFGKSKRRLEEILSLI